MTGSARDVKPGGGRESSGFPRNLRRGRKGGKHQQMPPCLQGSAKGWDIFQLWGSVSSARGLGRLFSRATTLHDAPKRGCFAPLPRPLSLPQRGFVGGLEQGEPHVAGKQQPDCLPSLEVLECPGPLAAGALPSAGGAHSPALIGTPQLLSLGWKQQERLNPGFLVIGKLNRILSRNLFFEVATPCA